MSIKVSPVARDSTATSGPLSLARVLQTLEVLGNKPEGATLAEICEAVSAPRSSTFALLKPMLAKGYLARHERKYLLGPRAFVLASSIMNASDQAYLTQSVMSNLSEQTGLTILFSVMQNDPPAIVHRQVIQSTRSIRYMASTGTPRPIVSTASGRAMLAFSPPQWTARYLDTLRDQRPNLRAGGRPRQNFEVLLDQVRRNGYSASLGDMDPAVGAVAAPVLGAERTAVATICIAGPLTDVRRELSNLSVMIRKAGEQLSSASQAALRSHPAPELASTINTRRVSRGAREALRPA